MCGTRAQERCRRVAYAANTCTRGWFFCTQIALTLKESVIRTIRGCRRLSADSERSCTNELIDRLLNFTLSNFISCRAALAIKHCDPATCQQKSGDVIKERRALMAT